MDSESLLVFGIPLALFAVGLFAGRITEARHFASLSRRERETQGVLLTNLRRDPLNRPVLEARLVSGQVVVSTDYFKSVCASVRRLVGGRIRSYETLLERGRREALLRLKDQAIEAGAELVLNVRIETMTVARTAPGGVTGVEVLAYGTAVTTAALSR